MNFWTPKRGDRLQAFHMRCLRQIVGGKWYDHVTNNAVRATTGVEDIESRIRRRRLALFGHVVRQLRAFALKRVKKKKKKKKKSG